MEKSDHPYSGRPVGYSGLGKHGPGAAGCWGGQSAVFLDLSGGDQASQKVNLAGARNEYLYFLVMVNGASPYLQAALEGGSAVSRARFFVWRQCLPSPRADILRTPLSPWEKNIRDLVQDPCPFGFLSKLLPAVPLVFMT